MGSAVVKDPHSGISNPIFSTWATLKGQSTLTKQSILCRMRLYNDKMGVKLLWGPERYISFTDIHGINRMLSGARTTGLKIIPINKERLEEITISGVADIPRFLNTIKENSKIEMREVEDKRGMFDFFK